MLRGMQVCTPRLTPGSPAYESAVDLYGPTVICHGYTIYRCIHTSLRLFLNLIMKYSQPVIIRTFWDHGLMEILSGYKVPGYSNLSRYQKSR